MEHRHLNHDNLTLAGIDSIIERGAWRDWLRLARAIRDEDGVAAKVAKLTTARLDNVCDEQLDRALFVRWQALAQRVRLVIADAEPLISLAQTNSLESLWAFVGTGEIVITDIAKYEVERQADVSDALKIDAFFAENEGRIKEWIPDTALCWPLRK